MMAVGMQQHDAVDHDTAMAGPIDEIAALQAVQIGRHSHGFADFGGGHVAVARTGEAGGFHGELHQARTIEPNPCAAAPQIRCLDQAFGDFDEFARVSINGTDMAGIDETARRERDEMLVRGSDVEDCIQAQVGERRPLNIG